MRPFQGNIVEGNDVELVQEVSDDEMVFGIKLKLKSIKPSRSGRYRCTISNNYGTLRKSITLTVGKTLMLLSVYMYTH